MPKHLSLSFPVVRLATSTGLTLLRPLLYPDMIEVGGDPKSLVKRFVRTYDKKFLREGACEGLLSMAFEGAREVDSVAVELDAATVPPGVVPDKPLVFRTIIDRLPEGTFLAHLPTLGLQVAVRKEREIEARVVEAIHLEFARKERLRSAKGVIPTLWHQAAELEEVPVRLPAYSAAELRRFAARESEALLPKVCTKVVSPRRPCAHHVEDVLERTRRASRGKLRSSLLLIGPNGVGKSASILEFIRTRKEAGLGSKTAWRVAAGRMIHRLIDNRGWEASLELLVAELSRSGDLLWISNLAELFEVGQYIGNAQSVAERLREPLRTRSIRLVSECTPEEAARIEARAPGYLSLFHEVRVEAPALQQWEEIAQLCAEERGQKRGVRVEREAVAEAIRLERRFQPYAGYPGKTVRFLDGAIRQARGERGALDREVVIRAFMAESGMPRLLVDSTRALNLEDVRAFFGQRVFGQEVAVEAVVEAIAAVKAGLNRPEKPIASLLFAGPTGVGKTELTRALSEFFFGSPERLVRFDLSEFSDPASLLRLTGDLSESEGLLTASVRREPFSVLLLDELEKADPGFFDLLLQVLGSGRLTDERGRVTDFSSTVVITTSNIGAMNLSAAPLGFRESSAETRLERHFQAAVREFFRPELVNRLDRVIAFAPLSRSTVRRIVDRELADIGQREGIEFRGVRLVVSSECREWLLERGYDNHYGARQMQRTIRDALLLPLARQLNRWRGEEGLLAQAELPVEGHDELGMRVRALERIEEERKEARQGWFEVEMATDCRRSAHRILDGWAFTRVLNEIDRWKLQVDVLKRQRQQAELRMRESAARRARERTEFLQVQIRAASDLIARARALARVALDNEHRAMLKVLRRSSQEEAVYLELAAWRDRALEVAIDLLDAGGLDARQRQCTIAVYGPASQLRRLANLYLQLCRRRGFSAEAMVVSIEKGQTNWRGLKNHKPPQELQGTAFGVEIQVSGKLAFDYFEPEKGAHEFKEDNRTLKCAVLVDSRPPALKSVAPYDRAKRLHYFVTPDSAHRRSFPYLKEKTVRRFEKQSVHQLVAARCEWPRSGYVEKLAAVLDDAFRQAVMKRVAG